MTPAVVGLLGVNRAVAAPVSRLLVSDGNSISANWPARSGAWPTYRTWPNQIVDDPWMAANGFGVVNMAIKGCNMLDMSERAPMGVDKLAGLASETYVVVWELTNTMYYWGGEQTFHMHANYCLARRAAGHRVLIGTGISRNNEATYHIPTGYTWPQMLALNNMLRTYAPWFADGVVDFAAIPELGGEFSWQNTTMFFDHVHLTDAGSALCKAVVLAELQRQVAASATAAPEPTMTATAQPMPMIVATVAPAATATATVQPNVQSVATGQRYYMPIAGR